MDELSQIKKIIAVTTYGRAGSGLISSLMDGQNNILSFPDCYLKSYFKFWNKYKNQNIKIIIKKFTYYYSIYFDPNTNSNFMKLESERNLINKELLSIGKINGFTKLGRNKNETIRISKKIFTKNLLEIFKKKKLTRKNFFLAIHLVYTKLYNPLVRPPYIIFYLLHSPDQSDLNNFKKDNPSAKFIQMIREPVSSFSSAINSCIRAKYFKKKILNYYTGLFAKKFHSPSKKTFFIKLEDLHNSPEKSMKKLCKFMNIDFSENLLVSTFFKKLWFNEKGASEISGLSKNFIKRRRKNFSSFDFIRLELIFKQNIKYFNYKLNKRPFLNILLYMFLFFPFKFEKKIQEEYNLMSYLLYRVRIFKYLLIDK